ncbi:MAG: T9SS type A sorting domain-containing protein [Bacteroidetes bacterium]|nr:MAG: T9SS type A sorting domain-containing protein [Bacteroidota bacterium]
MKRTQFFLSVALLCLTAALSAKTANAPSTGPPDPPACQYLERPFDDGSLNNPEATAASVITFSVDMKNYSGTPFTTVYVTGDFNGYSGTANPLEDMDGDSIWTGTVNVSDGSHGFIYTVDNLNGVEEFSAGNTCAVEDPDTHQWGRSLEVSGDTILPTVCWNSCTACDESMVTFSVDMNLYTEPFTDVYVTGDFNGFSGTAYKLNGPWLFGLWTGSFVIPNGSHRFMYTVDNLNNAEAFSADDPCAAEDPVSLEWGRTLEVNGDITLPTVCFGSCYNCNVEFTTDSLPGSALILDGTGDWARGTPLNIITNVATFTAWIKPAGPPPAFAGLVFIRGWDWIPDENKLSVTSGLFWGPFNDLRWAWDDEGWDIATGIFPAIGEWSHIALVIEPTTATVYLNGIPYVWDKPDAEEDFTKDIFRIGMDPLGEKFNGEIDEVCVYNKPLTQDQIREEMHLTRTHSNTDGLIAYYQFNETGTDMVDYNLAGDGLVQFRQDAHRTPSTAPVGPGVSNRKTVTGSGPVAFGETGVTMDFSGAPSGNPDGEVLVTRLDMSPDHSPTSDDISRSYWVMHNFGNNSTFDELSGIRFDQIGDAPSGSTAQQYQLYARPPVADGDTWQPLATAENIVPGADGSVLFGTGNGVQEAAQFVITRPMATGVQEPTLAAPIASITPNPVAANSTLTVRTELKGPAHFRLFDANGRSVQVAFFETSTAVQVGDLAPGVYFYFLENMENRQYGKLIVR